MRWSACLVVVVAVGCGRKPAHDHHQAEIVSACSGKDLACPRPILYVASLAASQRYYRDQLGFHIDWTDGDPPDFGAVSRGDTQIFMCQGCQGHPGGWLWVATPDVDALQTELVKRGARIKAAPENKPWGSREMQVTDLDGNVLRIAGPPR
jgi:catechol 2,3-dioxygenase-like lactoylglutathione lyase family enzyme